MDATQVPQGYKSKLSLRETFTAIECTKAEFEVEFAKEFKLTRVVVPLIVQAGTGVNDQLDTVKKPVTFELKNEGKPIAAEVVQASTKWKRVAIADYEFGVDEGLWCDMHAIRKDYKLDNTHTATVEQWDWELRIHKEQKNLQFLKDTVNRIYKTIKKVEEKVHAKFPQLGEATLPENLLEQYPKMSKEERENEILKKHLAVFIIGIGSVLMNGEPHDDRAPDYDDWSTPTDDKHKGLNDMYLLQKAHIGEVQSTVWPPNTREEAKKFNIVLL